ncbi:L-glutamate gamma-semialdehyde dehydrogenase [Priestia endophytica]|uniref:L-glutamate gamma-semialdehyde dehydrogenase n=1 Tax=Priestia endophytica TaxID=135735 RepID=UPI002280D35E|nr:L-glutamate gamma-semialdehyde dehydrogenase [Priestia endophytica]MCY8235054.1 L-glutamate gamma-semialdehyde dehydrogenase [Priestia endophytica]
MIKEYSHEPFTDFSIEKNYQEMEQALEHIKSYLGKKHSLLIDGKNVETDEEITSINPANKEEVVGYVSKASKDHAENAMKAAHNAFESWRLWEAEARAELLFRAAAITRRRKKELTALLIKEGGKPWKEADADIAEGIDFMEYYGREMIRLKDGAPVKSRDGEKNKYIYTSMGVTVVIPPWNFAFAIMVGTTVAPIVTGNTVVLKPASNTPVIARAFIDILQEAGIPKGVVNFCPGSGSEVGDYLVDHPLTYLISFTGSREVGTRIYNRASQVREGQKWLKRSIIEMGGKDTVVVDKSADLEAAAEEIFVSAFGFSGQKCSAGSRAVIHEDVYDNVVERVVKIAETKKVGDPVDGRTYMGPVIDQSSFDKITDYIEIGKEEGRLVYGGKSDDSKGFFIDPTIFADVDPKARIMQEEIFGPVLAFSKGKNFKELIEIANNTEYGLTGAVFSNNREHLEYAKGHFHVGNLYFNRNCTGAIVGYHPFGGFNMSGTDSKAGGPDYLPLHMLPKTISEML